MTSELANFAARVRGFIGSCSRAWDDPSRRPEASAREILNVELQHELPQAGCHEQNFTALALDLFALQFAHNHAYRKICEARHVTPLTISHWSQIPAVPTAAFKEWELTCLAPAERMRVFYSSGTTAQRPSRHFHNAQSLSVYEASLWAWFAPHVVPDLRLTIYDLRLVFLAPPPALTPRSSLVHMFDKVRQELGAGEQAFCGHLAGYEWTLDFDLTLAHLKSAVLGERPVLMLGTAFSFVHLLDGLMARDLRFQLPPGSRVMETGGYKGRSRTLPKAELHALITQWLGVPASHIICEYGMSELSSQAYDAMLDATRHSQPATRTFRFPPWCRAQIISPETGREVAEGGAGLLRGFDLANVFSVLAIQTEDLAVRRGDGFELLGRAELAEPRGCSLMTV